MSIHWSVKTSAFALSVWTLSVFFAGWREINTEFGPAACLTLASGTVMTLLLIALQGYWIYFEEKSKGTLQRKVPLFDAIHSFVDKRMAGNRLVQLIQPVVSEGKASKK